MRIVRSTKYAQSLKTIITYISTDSKPRAFNFKSELDKNINNLWNMPFKFRQSIYFEDENIRDLIFKGYTVVYKVDELKEIITIIGIKKYQKDL